MFNFDGLIETLFKAVIVGLIVLFCVGIYFGFTQDIITDKPLQPDEVIIKTINGVSDTTYRYKR